MTKKLVSTFLGAFSLTIGAVSGQFSRPISVGTGAGATISLADLANVESKFAFYAEADYLINPFISIGLRGEKGNLNGNGHNSNFDNRYFAGNVNGKVRMGQFFVRKDNYSYYALQASMLSIILSNIYVGAGAGLIKNRIRTQIDPNYVNAVVDQGGELAEDFGEIHFVIPLNFGLDIPFGRTLYGPQWALNLNYQHTLTTNDNLDGIKNKSNDQYGFVSLGVKYALFNRK